MPKELNSTLRSPRTRSEGIEKRREGGRHPVGAIRPGISGLRPPTRICDESPLYHGLCSSFVVVYTVLARASTQHAADAPPVRFGAAFSIPSLSYAAIVYHAFQVDNSLRCLWAEMCGVQGCDCVRRSTAEQLTKVRQACNPVNTPGGLTAHLHGCRASESPGIHILIPWFSNSSQVVPLSPPSLDPSEKRLDQRLTPHNTGHLLLGCSLNPRDDVL